jgi:OmcA/MtrC family decaheme c-type cytochrome
MKSVIQGFKNRLTVRTCWLLLLFAAAISMAGAGRSSYARNSKMAYVTDATLNFPGASGLVLIINSASIASNGTISATYTLKDSSGLPLDSTGATTPGTISVSYIAGYIPNNAEQYTSYTTTTATGTAGTFTVAGKDAGGVLTPLGSGQYTYVFGTKAPTGFDPTATNTVGMYATRSLTTYNIPNNYASATYNFVPNGAKVTHVRDLIETATCDTCHDQLSFHGGSRRQVALCVMCHQPQSTDPTTGNTVDFKVMIHKLHLGSQLPSVLAGGSYIIGTTNFSTVVYPATSSASDATATSGFRCTTCHSQTSGATQAALYMTNPTRAACGSCHDNVNFATGVNHLGGFQSDDTQCAMCHNPQGENPFDASVIGAHWVPEDSKPGSTYPLLGGVQITLNSVTNGVAGKAPTINFTLQDGNGKPLPYSSMASLTFVMAGPTTDYGNANFGVSTTPGYVTESGSATTVICSAAGACTYTFTHAIPANSTGTFAISFYGSRVAQTLLAGTTSQQTVTESPFNNVIYFSVDGSPVVNRRTVVQVSNCNVCHVSLELHGGSRRNTDLCVMCHNPANTDFTTRPTATVVAQRTQPNLGIDFNLLVHRIHSGVNLPPLGASYTVIGFQGSVNDFTTVLYPAMSPQGTPTDLANCSMCHVNSSEQKLPLGLNATTNPQAYISPASAITAACTGCHADQPSSAHALSNTDSLGEACTVCHTSTATNGITPPFAVSTAHAQY